MLNVIVTGGSTGIGAALVLAFAKAGHRVLLTYFTGMHRAQQLQAQHPEYISITYLDQGDVQSVAHFASVVSRWTESGVDVLINNAALGSSTVHSYVRKKFSSSMSSSPDMSDSSSASTTASSQSTDTARAPSTGCNTDPMGDQTFGTHLPQSASATMRRALADEALLRVNSLGPLWVTESLADEIHKAAYRNGDSKATVIFVGSVGGGSSAVFPEYCAADAMSKSATTYLSKHLAAKYVQTPVDVMCISPGATETDMFRESTLSKVSDQRRFIEGMPKRKLIDPNDIAKSVLWLATQCPKGLFHGANLDASMGLSVRPGLQTETTNSR